MNRDDRVFAPSFVRIDENSASTSRSPVATHTSGFAPSSYTDVTLFRDRSTSDSGYAPFLDSIPPEVGSGDSGSHKALPVPLAKGVHVTVYPVANETDSVWIVKEGDETPTARVTSDDPRFDSNAQLLAASEKKKSPKHKNKKASGSPLPSKSSESSPRKHKSPTHAPNNNSSGRRKRNRDPVAVKERAIQRLDDVIVHERPPHVTPASPGTQSPTSSPQSDFPLETFEDSPKSPRKRSPQHQFSPVTSPTHAAAVRLASFSAVMAPTLASDEHVTSVNGHKPSNAMSCNGRNAAASMPNQYCATTAVDSQPYQYSPHSSPHSSPVAQTHPVTQPQSPIRSPPTSPNGQKSPTSPEYDASSVYHQPLKDVDVPSAKRLAKRLYNLEGFKKSDISKHLSKK